MKKKRQSVSGYEEEAKQVSGVKEFSAPRQRKQSVKRAPLDYGHTEEATFTWVSLLNILFQPSRSIYGYNEEATFTQSEGFIIKHIITAL